MELIRNTSALTVGTIGVLKQAVLLVLAAQVFGDHVSVVQIVGVCIVSAGVLLYMRWVHADTGILFSGARSDTGAETSKDEGGSHKNEAETCRGDVDSVGEGWNEYDRLLGDHDLEGERVAIDGGEFNKS
jgi:uncharacterized membrane protein